MQTAKQTSQGSANPEAGFQDLAEEITWLKKAISARVENVGGKIDHVIGAPPQIQAGHRYKSYAWLIQQHPISAEERLALILATVPYLDPGCLNIFIKAAIEDPPLNTYIGGFKGVAHKGLIPTIETALFLLGGTDVQSRLDHMKHFHPDALLLKEQIIDLEPLNDKELQTARVLRPTQEILNLLFYREKPRPEFSMGFPAKLISTDLVWEDLVLDPDAEEQVMEIVQWMEYGKTLTKDADYKRKNKPGYRCLFYGSPGTGKTMTASLMGKKTGRDVYKVDLSMVVSKYIGETEKNLSKIFDRAQNKNWILFFDEADALFGKRTDTKDAHDRYANQEVSYLLQRVEDFDGVVILSSNFRGNIDKAFNRRFQSIIHFKVPDRDLRMELWKKSIPKDFQLAPDIELAELANRVELAGGGIVNAVRYGCLKAVVRGDKIIDGGDLYQAVKKEYAKDGKTF